MGLGLGATLIVAALHFSPAGRLAEVWWLDLCIRYIPTLQPSGRIVHVDLDDKALDQIGRWPWPRRNLARMIGVLDECGARVVALDIILADPQEPRFVKEGATDLYAADSSAVLAADAPPVMVLDDVELEQALERSRGPGVFLPMYVDMFRPAKRRSRRERLIEALTKAATTRPGITRRQAAGDLALPLAEVQQLLATAKQRAFERRISALLRDRPQRSLEEVLQRLLAKAEPDSEDSDIARRAYLRQRALCVLGRLGLSDRRILKAPLPRGRAVPPLVTFARAVAHTGFVTANPDCDGRVRRTHLLVRTDEGVFPQFALAIAAEVLAADHGGRYAILPTPDGLTIACADGFTRQIPVDSKSCMRINWARRRHGPGLRHISAVAAADVWRARQSIRRNVCLSRQACIKIVEALRDPETGRSQYQHLLDLFSQADRLWRQCQLRRRRRQAALLFRPAAARPIPAELLARQKELEKKIDRACRDLLDEVDSFYLATAGRDDDRGQPAQLREIRRWRDLIRRAELENPKIRRRVKGALDRLRKEVAGKICLVGSTSTGAADFVPTPIHKRTPGVVVHAHILQTILSGGFIRTPPPWLSAALILLAGVLVALIASTRGPIESAILLLAAIVAGVLANTVAWAAWRYWTVAAAPIAAMLLSFAVITVYRQLTEQRQKRQITRSFKQYLSPAMVDRLAEDPAQASLGGRRRRLSCMFSDLAGFTSLSERLGPEGTVRLLNRYLDRVGQIIQDRFGGTLSNYEGDGVFAFFGAPIVQEDHAARAIRAALDCQAFLPEFNHTLQAQKLLPPGTELSVRIGISAGEVFVGNMGSTQRIAYTAIGDPVNLASRLEAANKFFGTRILVNDEAWQSGAEGVVGRPLGKILVVGKTEPVRAWEPLARDGPGAEALRRAVEDFARGADLYAAGDFQAARDCFQAVLKERERDAAARVYLRLCEEALSRPAGSEGFDGVIRLTEK